MGHLSDFRFVYEWENGDRRRYCRACSHMGKA